MLSVLRPEVHIIIIVIVFNFPVWRYSYLCHYKRC